MTPASFYEAILDSMVAHFFIGGQETHYLRLKDFILLEISRARKEGALEALEKVRSEYLDYSDDDQVEVFEIRKDIDAELERWSGSWSL